MSDWSAFWEAVILTTQVAGGITALATAGFMGALRDRLAASGGAIAAAMVLSALWSLSGIAFGTASPWTGLAESLRNLAWLFVIYRLFASDGRHTSVAPIRPVIIVLALIDAIQVVFQVLAWQVDMAGPGPLSLFNFAVMFRLLAAVGCLMLIHNLYLGASPQSRQVLRWPTSALAILFGFDLNFYTIAYLSGSWPMELASVRGMALVASSLLILVGTVRGREALRLRPSRAVTFHTASLMVIGSYFLVMFGLAQWFSFIGGNFARLMEFGILIAGSALALFILPSRKLRGWLKVMIAKHLFQHRYDYRSEWLRFTRTIGNAGDVSCPLEERVVKAVADIAESPAGLLLVPDENGELQLAARWQWPSADVPLLAMNAKAGEFFERQGFIVDLDDLRSGIDERGESAVVPAWLREETRAWAVVPLIHYARLTGIVVLARPPQARKFDWEDFDLLRVVGQQLASYLAEHAGQQALEEAARFDDFSRRIAFVMHDVKNLASQLSLLARNAELHADKAAFRADMLVTLRNSADKLNTLLARLSRYGGAGVEQLAEIDGAELVHKVAEHLSPHHPVLLAEVQECGVRANRDSLEQVLMHLVQNAIDASASDSPVFIALTSDGFYARFEVVDSGCGMSPDFVRTKLFKPFVSSKPGGFGIGAFEARELVRAMKGRLDVESREGLGTRFEIRLPLAQTSEFLSPAGDNNQKVA